MVALTVPSVLSHRNHGRGKQQLIVDHAMMVDCGRDVTSVPMTFPIAGFHATSRELVCSTRVDNSLVRDRLQCTTTVTIQRTAYLELYKQSSAGAQRIAAEVS
jgi:hypothetical protein